MLDSGPGVHVSRSSRNLQSPVSCVLPRIAAVVALMGACSGVSGNGQGVNGGNGRVIRLDAGRDLDAEGISDGGAVSGSDSGGASCGGGPVGNVTFPVKLLLDAADFELNSPGAAKAFLDCDPGFLSANSSIVDGNGNSWGPATLGSPAQQQAAMNLIAAIFATIGTPDCPGGPSGTGLHGWPNLEPRLTGVATSPTNNGPGVLPQLGGLQGFGVTTQAFASGIMNGELVALYKAAAIADKLSDPARGTLLTSSSSDAAFANAIGPSSSNPATAIGLADKVVQCALAISLVADPSVPSNPTTFVPNMVEDLVPKNAIGGVAGGSGGSTGGAGSAGGDGGAGGTTGDAGAGVGGAGAEGQISNVTLDPQILLQAADFELNSDEAGKDNLDCDPGFLTANPSVLDPNGNSWGPATLASPAQQQACANLLDGIFASIGTPDAPGGPNGTGLHGWPRQPADAGADGGSLAPRLTGVATNGDNDGPGVFAANGGLAGFGVSVDAFKAGTIKGELAGLYKAAAIADGLTDPTVSPPAPLTLSSSDSAFAAAIGPVVKNPASAIGMADNIAQCALGISLGLHVVPARSTQFTPNVVERLVDTGRSSGTGGSGGAGTSGPGGAPGVGGAGGGLGAGVGVGGGSVSVGSSGGAPGSGGSVGAGGAAPTACPDLDGDGVLDCQQTLAVNPGFAAGIVSWQPDAGGTLAWTVTDAGGNPASGAAIVTNLDTNPADAVVGFTTSGAFQCIPVTPGSRYQVAVQVLLPAGQGGGWGGFVLDYYSAPNCAGLPSTRPFLSTQSATAGSWQVVSGTTTQVPIGSVSIALRLVAGKPVAAPALAVWFDNVLVKVKTP